MNVSLGEKWGNFIEQKLKSGASQSAREMVRDGLRMLEQRDLLAQRGTVSNFEELQDALLAGIHSGSASPMTKGDWKQLQAEVMALETKCRK
jgi:putative addiction module CopG family antidote